jgi:ATP-dependent RNA helicase SUPV3L1/SUV3
VIFAETTKFDGAERRPLARWEVAQIAGRAGRGVGAEGEVRVLAGVHGFEPDAELVAAGVEVAAGRAPSGLVVERLLVEPALDDLDCDDPRLLARALNQWARAAATELDDHPWASPASVRPMRNHLKVLAAAWGGRPWPVDVRTAFGIAAAPVSRAEDLLVVARATLGERVDLLAEWDCGGLAEMDLVQLERIAGSCRSLASSARRLGGIGGLDAAELGALGDRAERRAVELLDVEIRRNSFGRCRSCGRDLQPRFDVCRRCRPAGRRPVGDRNRTRTVTSHVVRRDVQDGGSPAGHRGVEVSR